MNKTLKKSLLLFSVVWLAVSCSFFKDNDEEIDTEMEVETLSGIPYQVVYPKDLPDDLLTALKSVSKLERLAINRPASRGALMKRAQKDKELFEDVLSREGYFDGRVTFSIVGDFQSSETTNGSTHKAPPIIAVPTSPRSPTSQTSTWVNVDEEKVDEEARDHACVRVIFSVKPGVQYKIGKINIQTDSVVLPSSWSQPMLAAMTKLTLGAPVQLENVQEARALILHYFRTIGFPFAQVHAPIGDVDEKKKTISLTFPVTENSLSYIAETKITGLHYLNENFVLNRISWKNGDRYNEKVKVNVQNHLIKTNVLSNVQVQPVAIKSAACKEGKGCPIAMQVHVTEARPRSIGAGIRYSTATGIGGQLFWHHNNVLGNGEHLGVSVRSSPNDQRAQLSFDVPDVGGAENKLSIKGLWLRERTPAYSGYTLTTGLTYSFYVNQALKTSLGLLSEKSRITSKSSQVSQTIYDTHLIGMPFTTTFDTTDSFLDPGSGVRLLCSLTPYVHKTSFQDLNMVRFFSQGSAYLPLYQSELGEGRLILAGSLKIGTLFVKNYDKEASPAKRFYAGGPGSIRSYGYQKIGPTDTDGIPLGGRSLSEWTVELRYRATEDIGLVTFLEAASVIRIGAPRLSGPSMFYGAGFGVRYYSGLGPIRLDIAFPFNRRRDNVGKHMDSAFQIYISIGQAF